MMASPSTSTTARSALTFGFTGGTSRSNPLDQLGAVELQEDPFQVFRHDLWGESRQLDDRVHHLFGLGLAVTQIPDGQRGVVHEVDLRRGWVVQRFLPPR